MLRLSAIERIYLHRATVDMRKQIDGLATLELQVLCQDPSRGALFGFINAWRDKFH